MKSPRLLLLLALTALLAACAPGALGPPPSEELYSAGPYPATPLAAQPSDDGIYAKSGPDGLSLGYTQRPWAVELVGFGGWIQGAKARTSWIQGPYAVGVEAAFFEYGAGYAYGGGEERRLFGLAADASYTWPVPVGSGEGYFGPRVRAYWGVQKVGDGPYLPADAGVLPGMVLGVNLRVPSTQRRLTFSIEAALFVVSPWLTSESDWSAFSPISIALSYRF